MESCSITGHHRYSRDLVQGGMEIPCQLTFIGMRKELKKVRCNFARDLSIKAAATKAAPVTTAKILKEGSSCSKYADETLSNSKQCIVKKEPIDDINAPIDLRKDSCDVGPTTAAVVTNDVWITYGNHTLKLSDKRAIEQGEEMTDKHIQMAQHLAKIQFPVVGGLQSTLLQQKRKRVAGQQTLYR